MKDKYRNPYTSEEDYALTVAWEAGWLACEEAILSVEAEMAAIDTLPPPAGYMRGVLQAAVTTANRLGGEGD